MGTEKDGRLTKVKRSSGSGARPLRDRAASLTHGRGTYRAKFMSTRKCGRGGAQADRDAEERDGGGEGIMRPSVVCACWPWARPASPWPGGLRRPRRPDAADSTASQVTPAPRLHTPTSSCHGRSRPSQDSQPESVLHDTTQDIYFVSNINGNRREDNNGFISRVRPEGHRESQVHRGAATALRSMLRRAALQGDTLWVPISTSCARSTREPGPSATAWASRRWAPCF